MPVMTGKQRQKLANFLTTQLRTDLGKGPKEVTIQDSGAIITVTFSEFLSPLEKRLIAMDRTDLVKEFQAVLLQSTKNTWRDFLLREFGLEIGEIYGQIDLDQDCRTVEMHIN